VAVAGGVVGGFGCQGTGDFTILGYSTAPQFDPNIRSVYIPVFKNIAFHTSPHRGIETDITEAVVRELNLRRSPMRVVQDPDRADTELIGTVTQVGDKLIYNRNLQNFNREFDVVIQVAVAWRDLRTGRALTSPRGARPEPAAEDAFDPSRPPPPPPPPDAVAPTTLVTGYGRVIPELGESNATAAQKAVKDIARQIVNMMEQPWYVDSPRH
jgi:hypothetical protein